MALPYPPPELANRVGALRRRDSHDEYDAIGRACRDQVDAILPAGWTWPGKRVLDFGCGAGRMLRHFAREATGAEFVGCDIDEPSIDWLNANLNPPFRGFVNRRVPPLALGDGSIDLIYAFSVFTHLAHAWSSWLLEMHRVLAPDGLLVATFLGEGMVAAVAGEQWDESRIGANRINPGQPWDLGGPNVVHSPWWLRAHWGRAFEIVSLSSGAATGPDGKPFGSHGCVVARPLPDPPSTAELEAPEPDEPREWSALQHNLAQVSAEAADLRAQLLQIRGSRLWRHTAPLRRLAQRGR